MITIILLPLFFLLLVCIMFSLFYFLLPVMKKHMYKTADPIFSTDESGTLETWHPEEVKGDDSVKALICCSSERTFSQKRIEYNDIHTCRLFNSVYVTQYDCKFSCIGFGDCVYVCPQSAIIIKNGTAVVTTLCIGCGRCLDSCPKKLIKLIPAGTAKVTCCAADDKEKTDCSMYQKENNYMPPDNNDFKFWQSCYKLFKGNIWKK